MRRASSLALVALVSALLAGCGDDDPDRDGREQADLPPAEEHWSYADAADWPGTCASGTTQSPVDLTEAAAQDLPDPVLDYGPTHGRELNNGHTVQTVFDAGNTLEVDGTTYGLLQMHFHEPAEHAVDGEIGDGEVHLVHQAEDGDLAVLAVVVHEGAAHPALDALLDAMPEREGDEADLEEPVDPGAFLPGSLATFRYDGSLTTPPCTEGVHWMVLEEPVTWSAGQLAEFGALYDRSSRPLQQIGDRTITLDSTG